ncbi:hypothetical protein [Streptomyces triticirhizae]|uniref:hypothetical protein n=1 Tax=Streptomyces triticirhizae TaxID=2483353 RepID=UPI0011C369DD|nr:hypothetical protein [Streptomyces triticirhizae]
MTRDAFRCLATQGQLGQCDPDRAAALTDRIRGLTADQDRAAALVDALLVFSVGLAMTASDGREEVEELLDLMAVYTMRETGPGAPGTMEA